MPHADRLAARVERAAQMREAARVVVMTSSTPVAAMFASLRSSTFEATSG